MRWRRASALPAPDAGAFREIISENVAIAAGFDRDDHDRLCDLATDLIVNKRWEPVGGVTLSDEMLVTIAANAAIPILSHGVDAYRAVRSILVYPTTRASRGRRAGPVDGVFSSAPIPTVGQASPNTGPLALSWDAARSESRRPGSRRNVVIHEFAHKIDMLDGYSDGVPPLRGPELSEWRAVLREEYERLEPVPSDEVLRPYAWTNPAEFFAVSTEVFFCTPRDLREMKPRLYEGLASFYGLDPATRWAPGAGNGPGR